MNYESAYSYLDRATDFPVVFNYFCDYLLKVYVCLCAHVVCGTSGIMDWHMQTLIEKYWTTAWNLLRRKESTRFVYIQGMRNRTIFMLRVIKVETDAHKERGGSFAPLTVLLCLGKTQNEFLPAEVNSEDSPPSQKREFYSPIHFSSAFPALCQPLHCVTHPQCKGKYSCHAQIGERRIN